MTMAEIKPLKERFPDVDEKTLEDFVNQLDLHAILAEEFRREHTKDLKRLVYTGWKDDRCVILGEDVPLQSYTEIAEMLKSWERHGYEVRKLPAEEAFNEFCKE